MIYTPSDDSYLLLEQVEKYAFGKVLDMGTGSGILAINAAKSPKVKSVLAADIFNDVISYINKQKLKKIKAVKSDLFENIKGKFDTIMFNPPYLPADKREAKESALTTTGGKHGYEVLENFLLEINNYLTKNGIGLILFSSLTNKNKVNEILDSIGYEYEELSSAKIPFETLYTYKIKRNWLMNGLFGKAANIKKLMKGHRGMIYTGKYKNKKIAIKAQRKDISARTVNREAVMIKKLNKYNIAPKLLFKGNDYFAYEYVEGKFIIDFLKNSSKNKTKKVLFNVLNQCRTLDKLKISKEEMHNPWKHVVIGKKITLVDFERAHYDLKPKNVTQFLQYILRNSKLLAEKGIKIDKNKLIQLGKEYKNNQTDKNYNEIRKLVA